MVSAEFATKLLKNPRAFGKATAWEDMSPKERAIKSAMLRKEARTLDIDDLE